MSFFTPVFKAGLQNPYPFSDLASRKLCHHFLNCNIRKNDLLIRTFDHTSVSYLLIWNWKDKSTSSRSFAPIVPSKTFTRFRTKMGKVYTRFRPKNSAKNPTLWGGTHLHGLYKGSPPPREVSKVKKIQSFISEADFLWVCWLAKKQASVVRINGSPYYWRFFLLVPKKELSPNDTFKFGRQRV